MTTTTTKAKADDKAADELLSSSAIVDDLTGYDEVAIKTHFGRTVEDLSDEAGITFLRACLFAHYRQTETGGKNDLERFKAVQSMRFGDLQGRFAADDGEDPELPGSTEGKGSTSD